jgi:hypothetical protein
LSTTAGNVVAPATRPAPAPWASVPRNADHDWNTAQTLHVAAAYSNPFRWASRRALFLDFRRHMQQQQNVVLHVAEIAYGDRPFEVTSADNPNDLRYRAATELFHKENLCNLAIRHFPAGWKYGAILDGDFHMTRQDWALETVHQLQHHPWVQLYSSLAYLGPDYRPHRIMPSFAWNWLHDRSRCVADADTPGAVGGGWAFTSDGLEATGGLLEVCILGSGDWHMGFGLVGRSSGRRELEATPAGYGNAVRAWQTRAAALDANIGCVPNHAVHFWHGMLRKRGYGERVDILVNNAYDPTTDVCHDSQGVLRLTGNKPKFRDDIRSYFRSREEDESGCNEQPLV